MCGMVPGAMAMQSICMHVCSSLASSEGTKEGKGMPYSLCPRLSPGKRYQQEHRPRPKSAKEATCEPQVLLLAVVYELSGSTPLNGYWNSGAAIDAW